MNRTRRTAYSVGMGLATAVIATIAIASALLLTRYGVYEKTSASTGSPLPVGTHVLARLDGGAQDGALVVFRDARHADDQIGQLGQDTLADSEVVGVVIRHGSLPYVLGYPLMLAAAVGVPVGALVGLLVGMRLARRREDDDADNGVAVAASEVVPTHPEGDWDRALMTERLALVMADEPAPRDS
jgi:hypothetical protein